MKTKVNRKKSISKLIDELGYKKYTNEDIVKTLRNEGEKEVEIEFFKLEKYVTNSELLKEYETRNLTPDVGAIISFLIENPKKLYENKYIGVQIENNCYANFCVWLDGRKVGVNRNDLDWSDWWWFAGVRKFSPQNLEPQNSLETLPLLLNDLKSLIKKYEDLQ